jgi:hypothetical protein
VEGSTRSRQSDQGVKRTNPCGERVSSLAKKPNARDFFPHRAARRSRLVRRQDAKGRCRARPARRARFRSPVRPVSKGIWQRAMGAKPTGTDMTTQFRSGQTVRLSRSLLHKSPAGGEYKIIRLLPDDGGEQQYRVKSAREPHERVVKRERPGKDLSSPCGYFPEPSCRSDWSVGLRDSLQVMQPFGQRLSQVVSRPDSFAEFCADGAKDRRIQVAASAFQDCLPGHHQSFP